MSQGQQMDGMSRSGKPYRDVPPTGGGPTAERPLSNDVIDVIETTDRLATLGGEWTALQARAGRPHQVFQTYAFAETWLGTFADTDGRMQTKPGTDIPQLSIVTVRRDGRLVLVLPLVTSLARRAGAAVRRCSG
jgi:hypothetical protein